MNKRMTFINLPGRTGEALETLLNSHPEVRRPKDAAELNALLKDLPKTTKYLIYSGGHGAESRAEMGGIRAEDVRAEIPLKAKIFLFTCHQGEYEKEWARAHGVPEKNVFGIEGVSYSKASYRSLKKLIRRSGSVEMTWLRQAAEVSVGHLLDTVKVPNGKSVRQILFA